MGTEELRAAVLQEANAEATAIIEAADAQASQIVLSEKRRLEEQNDAQVTEHRVIRDKQVATQTAALRIELRNAILRRKQDVLNDLYHELEEKLLTDDASYHAYLEHAVRQLGQEAPVSIECRKRDESVIAGLLPKDGNWTHVRLETTLAESSGGFMARYSESALDLTVSAASAGLRERTLVDVAQILFGDRK